MYDYSELSRAGEDMIKQSGLCRPALSCHDTSYRIVSEDRKGNDSIWEGAPNLSDGYLALLPECEQVERNVRPFRYNAENAYQSELQLLRRQA